MAAYDVIIVGAGPAGLSLAVELAEHVRVLVLERAPFGHTAATWYSYGDRVRDHGLDDAVAFRTDRLVFVSPNHKHEMFDDCVVLDHGKVLDIWLERARARGAELVHGEYLGHDVDASGVTVRSSAGEHRGRLLVDCTGPFSPIVAAHDLIVRKDAWVLAGARVRLPAGEVPLEIGYYPLGDDANTYLGIHPFNDTERNVYVFQGQSDTLGDPAALQPLFDATLAERFPTAELVAPISGSIVSGVLRKYALERVVFFGAAGMMNPEAIGMGFNEILRQVRGFAAGLRGALADERLGAAALHRVAMAARDREAMYFQRIIGAFSLHFVKSEAKWDGGVKWLNSLGAESRNWMRNEMSLDWIRRATLNLHKAVPIRETVQNIPPRELAFIGGQLARFVAITAVGEARRRFEDVRRRLALRKRA
ncbi:MAG: FAD-dependent oxidoreductase [Deltaproteobacteria bacterium]|nr:MAG: FAD-dependent oxidoreductase [Deltaproteobacteria bacterium]